MQHDTEHLSASIVDGRRSMALLSKKGEMPPLFARKRCFSPMEKSNSPRTRGYGENALIPVAASSGAAKACCAALLGLKGQGSMRRLGERPAIGLIALGNLAAKSCIVKELHLAFAQIFAGGIQFKKIFFFLAQHGRRFPGYHVLFQGKDGSRAHDRSQLRIDVFSCLQACL